MTGTPRRAVLFDLDGTLVDSAPDIAAAADRALADCGVPGRGIERIRGYIGGGAERLIHRCLTDRLDGVAERALFDAAFAAFFKHYAADLTTRTQPYPGVIETLASLAARGYRLGCVTNKPARFTTPLLTALALAPYFDAVVAGDTLPVKKPDPAPLLHAMTRLGTQVATTTMVGDSMADLNAARAAGMRVLCVSYGYSPTARLADHAPDALIDRMPDLLPLLPA
ncbi:MAG: phosphoglycolate phosphatase [Gammaproteobacteria bacterium]|nr:phosphoglycolate phosphatase [Gammaproteobacteria bacterium]